MYIATLLLYFSTWRISTWRSVPKSEDNQTRSVNLCSLPALEYSKYGMSNISYLPRLDKFDDII